MASTYDFTQGGRYPFFDVLLQTIPELHHPRLQKYKIFWDKYMGAHWPKMAEDDGITRQTYNYCKVFVDKIASYLVSRGVGYRVSELGNPINIKDDATLQSIVSREQLVLSLINETWTVSNKKAIILNEMSKTGGITGDAFIQVGMRDTDINDQPIPVSEQDVQIIVVPSEFCFPLYDIVDRTRLIQLTFIYPKLEVVEGDSRAKIVVLRQVYSKETIVSYKDGAEVNRIPNVLGEIPFVHIPNYINPGSHFGISDLDAVHELNVEFNRKMSELADIIAYSISPITVIKGAKASNIVKASKKVWSGLPADADVFNLELKSDFAAMFNYVSAIKTAMHEIGKIPENALGREVPISNTSGAAIQTMYEPLMDLIREKRTTYGDGINKINRLILKFYEKSGRLPTELSGKRYAFDCVFADPLPKDRQMLLDELGKEVALGMESKSGGMERLGTENPQEKMREITQEKLADAKLSADIMKITGVPPETAGNPAAQFLKASDTAAKINAQQSLQ